MRHSYLISQVLNFMIYAILKKLAKFNTRLIKDTKTINSRNLIKQ